LKLLDMVTPKCLCRVSLAIVLHVLRLTASNYLFGIFKLFTLHINIMFKNTDVARGYIKITSPSSANKTFLWTGVRCMCRYKTFLWTGVRCMCRYKTFLWTGVRCMCRYKTTCSVFTNIFNNGNKKGTLLSLNNPNL
jgi:hypothetical protein